MEKRWTAPFGTIRLPGIRNEGQNYVQNGKVIHLRAYHLPNFSAFWMPDKASRENSLEAYRRLRGLGFNFTISRNYNFAEGETNYLRGSFEAADEFGHLWSLSLLILAVQPGSDRSGKRGPASPP